MLHRKYRRRHQKSDLFSTFYRLESRTDRDLSLSEADVSAK